jgi:DNA-binding NtrC family response regulator
MSKHLARYPQAKASRISDAALGALRDHPWPGNVRELDHTVERAILLSRSDAVEPDDLGLSESRTEAPSLDGWSLEEMEQHMIRRSLERHQGNVSKVARELGLARGTLYTRMKKLGL